MIIVNSRLKGANTYDITIGEGAYYRAFAYDLDTAIDLVADHLVSVNATQLYFDAFTFGIMAEHSNYRNVELFAKAHNLICCGKDGIYVEITSVKGNRYVSEDEWYEIVSKHLIDHYHLSHEDAEMAASDIVCRCFCYYVPTLSELPKYIAEYMNR